MFENAAKLRVYNTLSRQKEDFRTIQPGRVGMYVCGPTVYKPSHVGHMVGPVIFDTIRRYLQYIGYEVDFVVNITDVDDKLIVRAREQNTTVKELAERMTRDYVDCLAKLGVEGITRMPRATEHIPEMLDMIAGLIAKGHAYPSKGDVYFDVTTDADYGKLCNRDPEQMEAGARIEVSDRKRNPGDFALWKSAKPGEPAWESPWGAGRPGWHIECSAMSMKYLGKTLDIHGGGLDLQFPHHENELAQSESFTGQPFANYWLHNGLMKMGHTKMAGSVGNVINVVDLLQKHHPETVRLLLLSTHYRSPIEWSEERIGEIRRSLEGFYRFFARYERVTRSNFYELRPPVRLATFEPGDSKWLQAIASLRTQFLDSMADDFNTGGAVGAVHEMHTTLNRLVDAENLEGVQPAAASVAAFQQGTLVLKELSQMLGLFRAPVKESEGGDDQLEAALRHLLDELRKDRGEMHDLIDKAIQQVEELHSQAPSEKELELTGDASQQLVKLRIALYMKSLINMRKEARAAKNFALADELRQRLNKLNITLEDRPGGTGWRIG